MRSLLLTATLFATAMVASATTYQFSNASSTLGDPTVFAIQKVSFDLTSSTFKAVIDVNYNHGDTTLSNINSGSILSASDLFFTINGTYAYGVATKDHSNSPNSSSAYKSGGSTVQAGELYKINAGGLLTAFDVLGDPNKAAYRPDVPVWMWNNGAGSLTAITAGTRTVSSIGGPTVEITLNFTPNTELKNALAAGTLGFEYTNGTCANSVITGNFGSQVPEPGTFLLLGLGLTGFGWRLRRRSA